MATIEEKSNESMSVESSYYSEESKEEGALKSLESD